MHIISKRFVRTALSAVVVGTTSIAVATSAFAATGPSASPASAVTTTPGTLASIQAAGAAAIAARELQLTKVGAELAKAPSCDANGAIASEISTDGPALTTLGQKLAADTTVAVAQVDFRSIFTTYRVYLVVTPQAFATAACGHVRTASTRLTTDEQKLAAKVTALPDGPVKTAAQASLADLTTQLGNATSQANAAASSLAGIVPDRGDRTVEASNAAAVASAHSEVTTSRTDLLTALRDAKAVVADLQAAGT